jgi:3-deoxy-D-arabino-heptulosonate 7-phosphate (DAHP) synthase
MSNSKRKNPDRYFGSDLNKFIHEECGKKMVVNNIDLIMLKLRKDRPDTMRVIESKHTNEKPMVESQKNVLRKLKQVFISGNIEIDGMDLELYVVKGDQPYDRIEVYDSINEVNFTIEGKENVINWLEMND